MKRPTKNTRAAAEKALHDARSKRVDLDAQIREVSQELSARQKRFGESVLAGADPDELTQAIDALENERQRLTQLQRDNATLCESIAAALDRDRQEHGIELMREIYGRFDDAARKASIGIFDEAETAVAALEAINDEMVAAWNAAHPLTDRGEQLVWSTFMHNAHSRISEVRRNLDEAEAMLAPKIWKL